MTRSELIKRIYNNFPNLQKKDADMAVRILFDEIHGALCEGKRVEVRGFGSFKVIFRKARMARNPRSGASVSVGEKYIPRFRASRELQKRLKFKVDP